MSSAKRVVLASRPHGEPGPSNFRIEDFAAPTPKEGEVLLRTIWLSLDPYMRGRMNEGASYTSSTAIGDTMPGQVIGEVIVSRSDDFKPGDLVLAPVGWASHSVLAANLVQTIDERDLPVTTSLGVLGMPGFTAYAGLREIGQPKPGETVVVAAASGPVGSLVGQLARLWGARAVGIAGGSEKCAFVRDELGFDAVVDHRSPRFAAELAAACPDGIDVYFENVGGIIWQAVIPMLNRFARIPVCGLIADYNGSTTAPPTIDVPGLMRAVLSKSLSIRGFINFDLAGHRPAFLAEVSQAIRAGKIAYREDITDGIENAPTAFLAMLRGRNFGKAMVRIGGQVGRTRA